MSEFRFFGRERVTVEVDGTFDAAALELPTGLEHDTIDGRARASLFAFFVDDLRIAGVPLLRWSYPELLWRIAVTRRGVPGWWAIACDLPARGPRWAAKRYVRYDVRAFAVEVTRDRLASRGPLGELEMTFLATVASAPVEHRALFTSGDALEVPWGDDDTPGRRAAVTVVVDSLSQATVGAPITWDRALLREGREHRCGVARR